MPLQFVLYLQAQVNTLLGRIRSRRKAQYSNVTIKPEHKKSMDSFAAAKEWMSHNESVRKAISNVLNLAID